MQILSHANVILQLNIEPKVHLPYSATACLMIFLIISKGGNWVRLCMFIGVCV